MMSKPDYMCKQTVFVFASDGDRISLSNDNLVVTGPDGKVMEGSCAGGVSLLSLSLQPCRVQARRERDIRR